jgi:hypothetical protein
MRNFFHAHWKVIVALVLLILVAVLTVTPNSASAASAAAELAARLRGHVKAIASSEHNTGTPLESDFPAEGLAAPAHTTGVTLSDHSSYNRHGYPALMITDTAFMRYRSSKLTQS